MKLNIYKETVAPEETEVCLRLVEFSGGGVSLKAVDRNGCTVPQGDLLTIGPDGTVRLNTSVNLTLGFPLTTEGRLSIKKI